MKYLGLLLAFVVALPVQGQKGKKGKASVEAVPTTPIPYASSEETLKGIASVDLNVMVAIKDSSLMDSTELQNHVELKLRQSGLQINERSVPTLSLRCVGIRVINRPTIAISCRMELKDLAYYLVEGDLRRISAVTYITSTQISYFGNAVIREAFYEEVDACIEQFLNDWLKQNPR